MLQVMIKVLYLAWQAACIGLRLNLESMRRIATLTSGDRFNYRAQKGGTLSSVDRASGAATVHLRTAVPRQSVVPARFGCSTAPSGQ